MSKTILLTGATDGIGLETAKQLVEQGHNLLIHGRSQTKLDAAKSTLKAINSTISVEGYIADLSDLAQVRQLAQNIIQTHDHIDAVINNAGVYTTPVTTTEDGLDIRFVVNTIAPYVLTKNLMPLLNKTSRVVNLSSAAQAPVSIEALKGNSSLSDSLAYAQSKLALTMWSRQLGLELKDTGPLVISVNPASMLGSKMVKDAYGVNGGDLSIGADILTRLALSDEFNECYGEYFDNDIGRLSSPHPDALNQAKVHTVIETIESLIS
ncbi:SDR family NAD(P)-dependent oxidoreductase [Vibrio sp. FNV 38]|nr:SDR family NAD(P)-dependent oxidoreductase [Vibrio sp. FNV 38]